MTVTSTQKVQHAARVAVDAGVLSAKDAAEMLQTGKVSADSYNLAHKLAETKGNAVFAPLLGGIGKLFKIFGSDDAKGVPHAGAFTKVGSALEANSKVATTQAEAADALWKAAQEQYEAQGRPPPSGGLFAFIDRAGQALIGGIAGSLPASREGYLYGSKVAQPFVDALGHGNVKAFMAQLSFPEKGRAEGLASQAASWGVTGPARSDADLAGDVKKMLGLDPNTKLTLKSPNESPLASGSLQLHLTAKDGSVHEVWVTLLNGKLALDRGEDMRFSSGIDALKRLAG